MEKANTRRVEMKRQGPLFALWIKRCSVLPRFPASSSPRFTLSVPRHITPCSFTHAREAWRPTGTEREDWRGRKLVEGSGSATLGHGYSGTPTVLAPSKNPPVPPWGVGHGSIPSRYCIRFSDGAFPRAREGISARISVRVLCIWGAALPSRTCCADESGTGAG